MKSCKILALPTCEWQIPCGTPLTHVLCVNVVNLSTQRIPLEVLARIGSGHEAAYAILIDGAAWEKLDLVFPNTLGRPLDGTNLLKYWFYPLLKRANLPRIRFHDLRHTAATLLLARGINPKVVSEMLGHSHVSVTLGIYSHVMAHMQQQAAAAMDAALRGIPEEGSEQRYK